MKFGLIVSAMLFSIGAQAGLQCESQVATFLQTYKSNISDCRDFGNQEACDNVCGSLVTQVVPVSSTQTRTETVYECGAQEKELIAKKVEQVTLDKVKADLAIEGIARGGGLGKDDRECLENAKRNAEADSMKAVNDCNNRSNYFRNCAIVPGTRISKQPAKILPINGHSKIELRDNYEAECRSRAVSEAISNAISNCQSQTGVTCELYGQASPIRFEKWKPLFGDRRVKCQSTAQALPVSDKQISCAVDVIAKNKL